MNDYFSNIGKTLAEDITASDRSQQHNYSDHTLRSRASSFVLYDTDPREVYNVLMGLGSDSAPGWDGITTKILNTVQELVVPLISHLANSCFSQGKFPPALKQAIITPVYKGGDRDDVSNYRPISVLPAISKIIEKLINKRLTSYTNKFNIISQAQYGFKTLLLTK